MPCRRGSLLLRMGQPSRLARRGQVRVPPASSSRRSSYRQPTRGAEWRAPRRHQRPPPASATCGGGLTRGRGRPWPSRYPHRPGRRQRPKPQAPGARQAPRPAAGVPGRPPPRAGPRRARRRAGRRASLPIDAPGAAGRAQAPTQSPTVLPTLPDRRIRSVQPTHQPALCSVARSRACGRSLPSGSRAQPTSSGRAAPRGSCPYALSGAVLARLAVSASGHVPNTCPRSAARPSGRDASAVAIARTGSGPTAIPAEPWASGPWASRVTTGGDDGSIADLRRSATRMSSGRTAGVRCRTTIRSVAQSWSPATAARSSASDTTAARVSSRRTPLLVRRSTSACAAARNASAAEAATAGATPGSTTRHCEASSSGRGASAASTTSITSIPSGRAASRRSRTVPGSMPAVREISRYSASLAAPVGAPPE